MAIVVIGAGYGDEGKGATVNSLSSPDSIVCRFNGGSQAGHTVVYEGIRHVFSHFGAGTLKGAATHLSHFFVCNPSAFLVEYEVLYNHGIRPKVTVSPDCPVTTIYDVVLNRIIETYRGKDKHGSVGVGFGETLERNMHPEYSLTVLDLEVSCHCQRKLRRIRDEWVPKRLGQLGINPTHYPEWYYLLTDDMPIYKMEKDFFLFLTRVSVQHDGYLSDKLDRVIFEGAQGLLLDQNYGMFPHVTRSNTGLKNVRALVGDSTLDVKYVTRAYTTRHGAGPLPFELPGKPYPGIEDKTNITGDYQGSLRFSYLNLDTTSNAIQNDKQYLLPNDKVSSLVTCMDQLPKNCTVICGDREAYGKTENLPKIVEARWFNA